MKKEPKKYRDIKTRRSKRKRDWIELLGDCDEAISKCEMKMARKSVSNGVLIVKMFQECGCTAQEAAEYLHQYMMMGYSFRDILQCLKRKQKQKQNNMETKQ